MPAQRRFRTIAHEMHGQLPAVAWRFRGEPRDENPSCGHDGLQLTSSSSLAVRTVLTIDLVPSFWLMDRTWVRTVE